MKTFKELVEELKNSIQETINKDSSKEELDKVSNMTTQLDSIAEEHEKVVKEKQDITEMYVKAVRKEGSSEKPNEDNTPTKPKTLEEIALEVVNSGKK